jgi:hypothetical protein
MNYAIVQVKEGLDGLNVHAHPGSMPPIDAIEPDVWMQYVGTPTVAEGLTTWMEVTYARAKPHDGKLCRGWVARHLVEIVKDKMFTENLSVHDRQVEYENSVSFPKAPNSTDLPVIDLEEFLFPSLFTPERIIIGIYALLVSAIFCLFFWSLT